jgi:dUTP pyrophosphatase
MKLKIKIKKLTEDVLLPKIIKKGDWIDLHSSKTVELVAPNALTLHKASNIRQRRVVFDIQKIPLGIAMKLPKGFEATMVARSSTVFKYGVISGNSVGIIDNSYSGNEDEWKFPAVALQDTTIKKGDRICQFRIQLSQKASFIDKIKWMLCSGIEFKVVDNLDSNNRGGFGSTD